MSLTGFSLQNKTDILFQTLSLIDIKVAGFFLYIFIFPLYIRLPDFFNGSHFRLPRIRNKIRSIFQDTKKMKTKLKKNKRKQKIGCHIS